MYASKVTSLRSFRTNVFANLYIPVFTYRNFTVRKLCVTPLNG